MKTRLVKSTLLLILIALFSVLTNSAPPAAAQTQPPPDFWRMGYYPAVPLASATQIAAGRYHTCALTTNGGVKCWGITIGGSWATAMIQGRAVPRLWM